MKSFFAVIMGSFIDDSKFFSKRKAAENCEAHFRVKLNLPPEDQTLRVQEFVLKKVFDPKEYDKEGDKEDKSITPSV